MNKIIKSIRKIYKDNVFIHRMLLSILRIKTNKLDGISICVRLNDDIYIDSIYDQMTWIQDKVGEILIHFNDIKDEKYLINKFKNIKNCNLKKYSLNDFDYEKYTNDFIDEMKYKWCFFFDSDFIFKKETLIEFIEKVNNSKKNILFCLSGLNVLRDTNGNIGYSNGSPKSSYDKENELYKPHYDGYVTDFFTLVGMGDIVCYVPYYTEYKKRYWYENAPNNQYRWWYYNKQFTGLVCLHLSWLRMPLKSVDNYINVKEILNNIQNNEHEYFKKSFEKIFKKTPPRKIDELLKLKDKYEVLIKNIILSNR